MSIRRLCVSSHKLLDVSKIVPLMPELAHVCGTVELNQWHAANLDITSAVMKVCNGKREYAEQFLAWEYDTFKFNKFVLAVG